MPAVEQKIITLTDQQLEKINQIKGMRERFKLHVEFTSKSPFSNLDSSLLQKLLMKGVDAVRHDLIRSGLTAEETEALAALKSQPLEEQKKKIEESKKSGVLYEADRILNNLKKSTKG